MTRLSLGWFADMFYFVFAGSALSVSPVVHLIAVKAMTFFHFILYAHVFLVFSRFRWQRPVLSSSSLDPRSFHGKKAGAGLRSAVVGESLELWQQISLTWIWLTKTMMVRHPATSRLRLSLKQFLLSSGSPGGPNFIKTSFQQGWGSFTMFYLQWPFRWVL